MHHPATCFNYGPDGAALTDLMPVELGLWIGEAIGDHRRVIHSIHIRAKSKAGALNTAFAYLPMFTKGQRFMVRVRRATAYDYREILPKRGAA